MNSKSRAIASLLLLHVDDECKWTPAASREREMDRPPWCCTAYTRKRSGSARGEDEGARAQNLAHSNKSQVKRGRRWWCRMLYIFKWLTRCCCWSSSSSSWCSGGGGWLLYMLLWPRLFVHYNCHVVLQSPSEPLDQVLQPIKTANSAMLSRTYPPSFGVFWPALPLVPFSQQQPKVFYLLFFWFFLYISVYSGWLGTFVNLSVMSDN